MAILMQAKKLLGEIVGVVEGELSRLGFRKTKGIYVYPLSADTFGWLGLNTATHRSDGRVGINPVVGVRHERIEKMVEKFSEETGPRLAPTISTALSYLMPEGRYVEWLFEPAPFDYESESKRMVRAVEMCGIPFMRSNATLAEISLDLERCRFASTDTAVYRIPIAHLLSGMTEIAVADVKRHLEELGDRKDLDAQRYSTFAKNLLREVSAGRHQ